MTDVEGPLEAGKCFRLPHERLDELRADAHQRGLSVQTFLEWKVFGVIAPRQRTRRDAAAMPGQSVRPRAAFNFRMTPAQLDDLKLEATRKGISVQALLELKVFGVIAPRQRNRRDARLVDQDVLALALPNDQEASDAA